MRVALVLAAATATAPAPGAAASLRVPGAVEEAPAGATPAASEEPGRAGEEARAVDAGGTEGAPAAEGGGAPEAPADPQARLEAAVLAYQLGRRDEAMAAFGAIVADPELTDEDVRQEARVYLGELLYVAGDKEGARRIFEEVLRIDPAYPIDHFRHPPDVCGFFDYVRSYLAPPPAPEPEVVVVHPPPLPWTGWLPVGGVYQLTHDRPVAGTAFLGGEIALGSASVALYALLLQDHSYAEGDEDERARLLGLKRAQWAVTAGYWALWAWARLDAQRDWRRRVRVELQGSPDGAGAAVRGRF